jgi:hypothetical protein
VAAPAINIIHERRLFLNLKLLYKTRVSKIGIKIKIIDGRVKLHKAKIIPLIYKVLLDKLCLYFEMKNNKKQSNDG